MRIPQTPTIAVKKADAAGAALTVVYTSATHYGTDTVTITVAAKAVTADMIADMPAATYTGSAILPTPAVKHGAATLVPGTDFDFGYADNTNAGTATLTVTGKGNYAGTAAKAFTILQKSFDGAVITLDHAALPYSGAEQTVNITSVTLAGWTPAHHGCRLRDYGRQQQGDRRCGQHHADHPRQGQLHRHSHHDLEDRQDRSRDRGLRCDPCPPGSTGL